MLLLFLLCRLFVCLLFRDSNMISISTAEFRYYVCYYNTSELWKTLSLSYKGLRQLRLSAFNELLSMKQVYGFHTWIFIARFLDFVFYIARSSEQQCHGVYDQSNLFDRMLQLHSYQPCPQD